MCDKMLVVAALSTGLVE